MENCFKIPKGSIYEGFDFCMVLVNYFTSETFHASMIFSNSLAAVSNICPFFSYRSSFQTYAWLFGDLSSPCKIAGNVTPVRALLRGDHVCSIGLNAGLPTGYVLQLNLLKLKSHYNLTQ